jgi:hypothetical protein
MSTKTCNICLSVKSIELFIKNRNICKDCNNKKRKLENENKKKLIENSTETKCCSQCNETKLLKLFIVNTNYCKNCYNKVSAQKKLEKKQQIIENNIMEKECKTCNIVQHIDNFRAGENICYECNKKKLYTWRENNKDQFLDICKKYRSNENVKIVRNEKLKEKYHTDENYKKSLTLRHSIRQVISGRVKKLSKKNLELLGCTVEQFKQWIEFNFIDDMSWDNYGTYWNLDHVTPVSSFDLTNEEEKKVCFQWSNTVPEIAKKNYEKFNKIDDIKIGYIRGRAYMFQDKFKYDLVMREKK